MRLHVEQQLKFKDELVDLVVKHTNLDFASLSIGEIIGVMEVVKMALYAGEYND